MDRDDLKESMDACKQLMETYSELQGCQQQLVLSSQLELLGQLQIP